MSRFVPALFPPPPPPPDWVQPLWIAQQDYQPATADMGPPPKPTGRVINIVCWTLIWLLALGLLTLTTVGERRLKAKPTAVAAAPSMEFVMAGKLAVDKAVKAAAAGPADKANLTTSSEQLLTAAGNTAKTPVDRLAMVAVYYEARGNGGALEQLTRQRPDLAATPALVADADLLRKIYTDGPASVDPADQEKLKAQLGWFGELALTQNQTAPDGQRADLLAQAGTVQNGMILTVVELVGGGALGVMCFVTAVVLLATGILHPTLIRPSPGGPPRMLVMFTVWFYGFVGNMVLFELFIPRWPTAFHEFLELVWTAVVLLAMSIRGTTWSQWRHAVGFHAGRGIPLEMACGLGGYLAGLPLVFVAGMLTLLLVKLSGVHPSTALDDELIGKLTPLKILGLWLTAGVMAPLIEELVFRGALYGHLRRRWNAVASGALVGLIFAMVHPQGWTTIPVLATVGFVLAMLREWRGSLVASVTAHGIHNTAIVIMAVTLLR